MTWTYWKYPIIGSNEKGLPTLGLGQDNKWFLCWIQEKYKHELKYSTIRRLQETWLTWWSGGDGWEESGGGRASSWEITDVTRQSSILNILEEPHTDSNIGSDSQTHCYVSSPAPEMLTLSLLSDYWLSRLELPDVSGVGPAPAGGLQPIRGENGAVWRHGASQTSHRGQHNRSAASQPTGRLWKLLRNRSWCW